MLCSILSSQATADVLYKPSQGGPATTVGGMNFVYKQEGSTGAAGATIIELVVAPGAGAPPHRHTKIDESFFILDGVFEVTVDGQTETAAAGAFVQIPGGTVHSFKNVSKGLARTLTISSPHGLEAYFRAAGKEISNPYEQVPRGQLHGPSESIRYWWLEA